MSILFLDQVGRADLSEVGGKGANLGELWRLDFPVPAGFVVLSSCYRQAISSLSLPADVGALADFRQRLIDLPLPASLVEAIEEAHARMHAAVGKDFVCAVRSSATAEDLTDASFAGQHETYYYVTPDNIARMVKKCWASLWSEAAFSYRSQHGIRHDNVDMAVIVQRMIRSEVSGVTFTADPVSGSPGVIITEASWGMGAAIVDGRVTPDQYICDKLTGYLTSIRIADKKFMVPALPADGQTSRLVRVPDHLRRVEVLRDDQVALIADWAKRSEQHFGCPQDLEWAIEDGHCYFLQSRPVTVLGQVTDTRPAGKYVLFKPLTENFTEPLLPLTQDILGRTFRILTFIHGRVYFKLSLFRSILPFRLDDEGIARIAYLSDSQLPPISWPRLVPFTLLAYLLYLTVGVLHLRTSAMPIDFMASFRARCRQIAADPAVDAATALQRLMTRTGFFEPIGNMVLMVNLSASRYISIMLMMGPLLSRWLPALRTDAVAMICAGDPDILSTQMGRQIWELAKTVRQSAVLTAILQHNDASHALEQLRQTEEALPFLRQLETFLAIHGHRTPREFEISSVRWEEDPAPIIGMVRNYLLADVNPDAMAARVVAERTALMNDIEAGLLQLPLEKVLKPRTRLLRMLVSRAKYFIRLRENSRFYHIMSMYVVRQKVLQMETRLLETGRLKCKDDVFYLNWHELTALADGAIDWADIESTIRRRRMEHIRLTKLTPPRTIGIVIAHIDADQETDVLTGQAASPGVYEGIARVIMDPSVSTELHPGEILVAPYTDPAWTPLFLTAHAAVVEVGSFLSHAGTIAREYGMPCVVDVNDCTRLIQSGDRLRVDGSTGRVTRLPAVEPPPPIEAGHD